MIKAERARNCGSVVSAANAGAIAEFRVLRGSTVVGENMFHCTGPRGVRNSFSLMIQDDDRAAGATNYILQARKTANTYLDLTPRIISPHLRATQFKR